MSEQVLTENEDKPLTGSWRAKIRKDKGFIMMVEEILQQIPLQGKEKDAEIRARVLENCETLWKLGAADRCGGNGKAKIMHDYTVFHKPVESINSDPEAQKETKNKSKKTKKKSCDC